MTERTAEFEGQPPLGSSDSPRGGFVFFFLALMGVATFAPCVILPEWRDYQAARLVEQREQHRLDQLKRTVANERRRLEAMQNDPTVVARIAQRDFGFRRPDEAEVAVAVGSTEANDDGAAFVPEPVEPPAWFAQAASVLPDFDYDAVFCDERTRPIVMLMSVSLIVLAAVLFHRRAPRTIGA